MEGDYEAARKRERGFKASARRRRLKLNWATREQHRWKRTRGGKWYRGIGNGDFGVAVVVKVAGGFQPREHTLGNPRPRRVYPTQATLAEAMALAYFGP